jgi:hypothetical protein
MTSNAYRKIFFSTVLLIVCIVSCKKKDTNTCETTMADIAGSYHLTKFESVSYNTGAAQDVTFFLTSCELSGIYKFNIDSTATYSELTNCNNSGSGVWTASETTFYTFFTSGTGNRLSGLTLSITSWDCTNLVLLTSFPSVDSNYRYTLTKL